MPNDKKQTATKDTVFANGYWQDQVGSKSGKSKPSVWKSGTATWTLFATGDGMIDLDVPPACIGHTFNIRLNIKEAPKRKRSASGD